MGQTGSEGAASWPPHLDAVLELVAWVAGAFAQQLAEDDRLLEEKDAALLTARQHAAVLLPHAECLLLQQLPLGGQLPLEPQFQQKERDKLQ